MAWPQLHFPKKITMRFIKYEAQLSTSRQPRIEWTNNEYNRVVKDQIQRAFFKKHSNSHEAKCQCNKSHFPIQSRARLLHVPDKVTNYFLHEIIQCSHRNCRVKNVLYSQDDMHDHGDQDTRPTERLICNLNAHVASTFQEKKITFLICSAYPRSLETNVSISVIKASYKEIWTNDDLL